MPGLFLDDNDHILTTASGLRPMAGSANIVSCTLSASTQELTLPTAQSTANGSSVVRVCAGSQGAFTPDAKVYALQLGTAGTFQVSTLG